MLLQRYENKIELEVRLPAGSPAEQRPAAALAVLEQGGFRVTSGDTLQLIERLSAVIEVRAAIACSVLPLASAGVSPDLTPALPAHLHLQEGFKVKLGSSDLEISSLDGRTALYPSASTA